MRTHIAASAVHALLLTRTSLPALCNLPHHVGPALAGASCRRRSGGLVPATAEHMALVPRGALTLEHLLQLGLAADGGAAGGRAGRPHRDGAGRVGAARSGAAGRDEALAIPALTEGQLGRAAEAV